MYIKRLSSKISYLLTKSDLSIDYISEKSHLSKKVIMNIIEGTDKTTIVNFEKICSVIDLSPNDLLLPGKIKIPDKFKSKEIKEIIRIGNGKPYEYYYICPNCKLIIDRDFQAYCDCCGCKLNWKNASQAKIVRKIR